MARRSFRVTGTNNAAKQVSVDWTNDLAGVTERGVSVTPQDYGAVADGVTDDSAAFVAAIAYLKTLAINSGSARLFVPAGDYYLGSTTLDLTHAFIFEGEGNGMVGGIPTRLKWDGSVPCIRLQYTITEGNRQIVASHSQAAGMVFRGLHINGGGTATATAHAFDLMTRASFYDCQAYNCGGNGWNIVATAGGGAGAEGNANCFAIYFCSAYSCKNGIYLFGADANAGTVTGGDYSQNREWGINDESFLGNTYTGVHTAGNTSGPFRTTNVNSSSVFVGCYTESDQTGPDFAENTLVIGGTWGSGIADGVYLKASTAGDLVVQPVGGSLRVNTTTTTADLVLDSANNHSRLRLLRATVYKGSVAYVSGTGVTYDAPTGEKHQFYFNNFATTGPALTATGVEVSGTKVVGAQGAAVADATDAASAITQLNALLARCRAHGLIAT